VAAASTRRRLGTLVAIVCAAGAAALGVAARRLAPPKPNVLFVLVDTLRADRVGRGTLTPFLDRLADGALVYDRAYAPSSWTVPSVASLLLGRRPFEHGALDFGAVLPDADATLPELLHAHGFETAALLGSGLLIATPFERGFDVYQLVGHPGFTTKPDGAELNAAALDWLDHRDAARPFFLYLHYMEPHFPYRPHDGLTAPRSPELKTADAVLGFRAASGAHVESSEQQRSVWHFSPVERQRLADLYDGEVAYLDGLLAALFAGFESRGALADTVVVVTADHGEDFGEHGLYGHGVSLYETSIRVPLIVRLPHASSGTHVARPVESAGIARTLLGVLGIDPPASFTIGALPLGADGRGDPVVSELGRIETFTIWRHRAAVVTGDRKLLVGSDGTPEIYDLRADAAEEAAGQPRPDDVRRAAAADLRPPGATPGESPSPEMMERLRALGYAGGPAAHAAP